MSKIKRAEKRNGGSSLSPTKHMTTARQLCDSSNFGFCAAVLRKNGAKGHETYRTWILEDQIRILVQYWEWLKKCFYAILGRQWYCLNKVRVVNSSKLHDFGTQLEGINLKFNGQQSRVHQFTSRGQTPVQIQFWSGSSLLSVVHIRSLKTVQGLSFLSKMIRMNLRRANLTLPEANTQSWRCSNPWQIPWRCSQVAALPAIFDLFLDRNTTYDTYRVINLSTFDDWNFFSS